MKLFLLKFSVFILIIVLLCTIWDVLITKNIKKSVTLSSWEIQVWEDIFNSNIKSDIVIYWSSRAWRHFDCGIIEERLSLDCYNLGLDWHNFWLQHLRHKMFFKYNIPPKVILVSLDVFSLDRRDKLYHYDQFLPYLFNSEIRKYINPYHNFHIWEYFFPLLRYYWEHQEKLEVLQILWEQNSQIPTRIKGFTWIGDSWVWGWFNARDKIGYYTVKLHHQTLKLFEEFLQEMEEQKIEVIFVYSPEYIEWQKFADNWDDVMKIYENYSKKYNIPFLDYSKKDISYQKELFYDNLHLNRLGAEKFTQELSNDLKDILSF